METSNNKDSIFYKALTLCKKKIEEKFFIEFGLSDNWKHKEFIELSKIILEKTKTNISTTTLKRIWGKIQYDFKPNNATINALANIIGYINWIDFVNKNITEIKNESVEIKKPTIILNQTWKKIYISISLLLILIVCFVGIRFYLNKRNTIKKGDWYFKSDITEGMFPFNAIVKYDISKLKADTVRILPLKDVTLPKNKYEITKMIFFPGKSSFYLVADNKYIDTINYFVTTNNWISIVSKANIPIGRPFIIFEGDSAIYKNSLYICDENFKKRVSDFTQYDVNYYNTKKDFHIDGDNFTMETRVKIKNKNDDCYRMFFSITGDSGFITIPFTNKTCYSMIDLYINENQFNGIYNKLEKFNIIMNEWTTIKLIVQNKNVQILLNNNILFSNTYKKSIGNIYSLRYRFNFCYGMVDFIKIYNKENELVLNDNFGGDAIE